MTSRGFTLIELLVVVMILIIIAAIAIPNLLRSRMQSNESAAIGNLRTVVGAQTAYQAMNHEYAANFAVLTESNPPYLEGNWTRPKNGYDFDLEGSKIDFWSSAMPAYAALADGRSFFVDASGVVRFSSGNKIGVLGGEQTNPNSLLTRIDEVVGTWGEELQIRVAKVPDDVSSGTRSLRIVVNVASETPLDTVFNTIASDSRFSETGFSVPSELSVKGTCRDCDVTIATEEQQIYRPELEWSWNVRRPEEAYVCSFLCYGYVNLPINGVTKRVPIFKDSIRVDFGGRPWYRHLLTILPIPIVGILLAFGLNYYAQYRKEKRLAQKEKLAARGAAIRELIVELRTLKSEQMKSRLILHPHESATQAPAGSERAQIDPQRRRTLEKLRTHAFYSHDVDVALDRLLSQKFEQLPQSERVALIEKALLALAESAESPNTLSSTVDPK